MMQIRAPVAAPCSRRGRSVAPRPRQLRTAAFHRAVDKTEAITATFNEKGEPCSPITDFDCKMTMSMEDEDDNGALTSWGNAPGPAQTEEWSRWMRGELSDKLVGLKAGTSRAEVWVTGVRSAAVVKGRKRANEIEFVLSLEGKHRKVHTPTVTGDVKVSLKTANKKDQITVSPAEWVTAPNDHQALADISAAAQVPMESELAIRLNDVLWDVEKRSMDESLASMEEAQVQAH